MAARSRRARLSSMYNILEVRAPQARTTSVRIARAERVKRVQAAQVERQECAASCERRRIRAGALHVLRIPRHPLIQLLCIGRFE